MDGGTNPVKIMQSAAIIMKQADVIICKFEILKLEARNKSE
jgi:hypothetical protein